MGLTTILPMWATHCSYSVHQYHQYSMVKHVLYRMIRTDCSYSVYQYHQYSVV